MIKFDKVSIKYIKEYYSLYNINFEIDNNTLLLGDESSGNSFVLRTIAKIDKNYEGDVYIDNKNLKDIKDKDLNLAYIPKQIYLFKNKSIFYNLMYPLKIRKVKTQEATDKILYTLKKYNLIEYFLNEKHKTHFNKKNQIYFNENSNVNLLKKVKVKYLNEQQQKLIMLLRAIIRAPKYILAENLFTDILIGNKINAENEYTLNLLKTILLNTNSIFILSENLNPNLQGFKTLTFNAGSIKK